MDAITLTHPDQQDMDPISLDSLDRHIIQLLQQDGRMQATAIARAVGQPVRTVRYRLNRLLTSGIVQPAVVVNPAAVGYTVLADVLIETEAGMVETVAAAVAALEMVSYVACSTGNRDVSMQVLARNVTELHRFINDVLHKIPGVRRTETYVLAAKLKDVHQWCPPG